MDIDLERRLSLSDYYQNNKEHCLEYEKEYYSKHRDERKKYLNEYYQKHKKELQKKGRNYYRKKCGLKEEV